MTPHLGRRGPRDAAASEIVGNILMIAVTVLLAAGLAFSLASGGTPTDPVSSNLVVEDQAELRVRHAGGEAIPVEGPVFFLVVGGTEERRPLTEFSADVSGGDADRWEIGEEVCVSCQVAGTIDVVTFVAQERTLLDWERSP